MKKRIIIIIVLVIVIGLGIFAISYNMPKLKLIGNEKQVLMLNEEYQELGTNIESTIKGKVDTSKVGTYKLSYTYHNQTLTRIVEVKDNTQLVMNLNGSKDTYVKLGQKYIESGCHVIDTKEGNLTSKVVTTGSVDTAKEGKYIITYKVTNKEGLECSKERVVHVVKDFKTNTKGIPVLMYHYVYTKDDKPDKLNANYILNTDLEKQLQYLSKENYYYPSYKELQAYIKGEIDLPAKSVILTFDDGQKGFLKYGIPLLEKYKIPATSFIIGINDGKKKVKKYASEYISFQSHSYNMHHGGGNIGHGGIISAMTTKQIKEDLLQAQELVQNTEAFAYPYGDVSNEAKKAIKEANILCSFTTHYGRVKRNCDASYLPRVRVLGQESLEAFKLSVE